MFPPCPSSSAPSSHSSRFRANKFTHHAAQRWWQETSSRSFKADRAVGAVADGPRSMMQIPRAETLLTRLAGQPGVQAIGERSLREGAEIVRIRPLGQDHPERKSCVCCRDCLSCDASSMEFPRALQSPLPPGNIVDPVQAPATSSQGVRIVLGRRGEEGREALQRCLPLG